MKKHPVDRRFAQALRQHEKAPRPEAWQRLGANLDHVEEAPTRRLLPFWYVGVAASVVVLLLAGYLWWRPTAPDAALQPPMAKVKTPKLILTPDSKKSPEKPALTESELPAAALPQLAQQELGNAPREQRRKAQPSPAERKTQSVELPALMPNAPVEVAIAEPRRELTPPVATEAPTSVPAQTLVAETAKPTQTVLIVKLTDPLADEAASDEAKPRKRNRMGRIFNQLVNAKNNERVDWNEVGFNPNRLLARAEEKVERGTQKVAETYHSVKEKTNY
ncbi:MAG: hypothetical protein H7Y12_15020 [Sphingobacteriaceae bacterium]|nr:hypothetical protein [Cytophagaceae bacterium]